MNSTSDKLKTIVETAASGNYIDNLDMAGLINFLMENPAVFGSTASPNSDEARKELAGILDIIYSYYEPEGNIFERTVSIPNSAFRYTTKVDDLVIPPITKEIGAYAFADSKVSEVSGGSGLYYLGVGAFQNCTALTTVDLRESRLSEIPKDAFAGCTSLRTVLLPQSIARLGVNAFPKNTQLQRGVKLIIPYNAAPPQVPSDPASQSLYKFILELRRDKEPQPVLVNNTAGGNNINASVDDLDDGGEGWD